MRRICFFLFCIVFFFETFCFSGEDISIKDPNALRRKLEQIRKAKKLPAVAASVVIGDRVIAASSANGVVPCAGPDHIVT